MLIGTVLALHALVAATPSPTEPSGTRPPAVRIYVFTAQSTGSAPSDEERGRLETARDLQDLLRRKSPFVLTATADEAQVVVEVINREERRLPEGGFGGKSLTKFRETIVRVKVSAGTDASELKGVGQGSWKAAEKDLVERFSKWVKNHVSTIPS